MIFFFGKKKKKEETIVVGIDKDNVFGTMSPKGGVGKTSVTVEVAFLIAQKDMSVALVDWDLWSPRLTTRLVGSSEGPGLLELLLGEAEPDEVVRDVEFTTVTGKVVRVKLVPASDKEALARGEVKRLAGELEDHYDKVKARAVALSNYLAGMHDVVFNDYPVPSGPAPAPFHKIAASATHWLNIVIDAVPTTAEYAARYVEMFYPSLPVFIVFVNMIKPVHHEYSAAVARAPELCKKFAAKYVAFIPFDGKLYDVKVSGAAPPASINYRPTESAALKVLRDAAMRIARREKPPGCVALHLKVL
jgi:MinD-like ATPase involved in chromosome partitioning or flagellar assembly